MQMFPALYLLMWHDSAWPLEAVHVATLQLWSLPFVNRKSTVVKPIFVMKAQLRECCDVRDKDNYKKCPVSGLGKIQRHSILPKTCKNVFNTKCCQNPGGAPLIVRQRLFAVTLNIKCFLSCNRKRLKNKLNN
jgi:hypothetical protein